MVNLQSFSQYLRIFFNMFHGHYFDVINVWFMVLNFIYVCHMVFQGKEKEYSYISLKKSYYHESASQKHTHSTPTHRIHKDTHIRQPFYETIRPFQNQKYKFTTFILTLNKLTPLNQYTL